MTDHCDVSRRTFLQTVGAAAPSLTLLFNDPVAAAPAQSGSAAAAPATFTPVDLAPYVTASSADFGPRDLARNLSLESSRDGLLRLPVAGAQSLRGIPFILGSDDVGAKSWVALSTKSAPWSKASVDVPIGRNATRICLAQFCDFDPVERQGPDESAFEQVGQHLADVTVVYEDGTEAVLPIRRRFEVNSPSVPWGHLSFRSLSHRSDTPSTLNDPLPVAMRFWGDLQRGVWDGSYATAPRLQNSFTLWVCALEHPKPDSAIRLLRFSARSADAVVLCGLSIFHGEGHPLQYERLSLFRITLPEPANEAERRWSVTTDLGVVARTFYLNAFDGTRWLAVPPAVIGDRAGAVTGTRYLYAEISASRAATVTLADAKTKQTYAFPLRDLVDGQELSPRIGTARLEVIDRERVWVTGTVVDAGTGRPMPARLAFVSRQGRYIPPYGHRSEINTGWFQDYGADVKLMDRSFAYVDGTFQVELPVGDVYVEVHRGFEYQPIRKQLAITPEGGELRLALSRLATPRTGGWVSADVHVHFLSPSTAVLEGQAEGLNLISLLAAQWGDMFSNVGDLPHGSLRSPDGETLIKMGTENRQHLLGHLALLTGDSSPVYPMSAAGQNESYIGDPVWTSLAEWAEAARKRDGLAIGMHFPYPTAEIAADILLGKIDAVELEPKRSDNFGRLMFQDWYRYLNLGCRLPAVGGTDKMSAGVAVGQNRTYANLNGREFSYANWAAAIRKGNTFVTSGPLLYFQAEGRQPGDDILVKGGGATVAVRAEVISAVPVHRIDIVANGRVVASREDRDGVSHAVLEDRIKIDGPGWVSARAASRLDGFKYNAHTSPVYLRVAGSEPFSADAAAYMLTLIEGSEVWTRELATRSTPDRMARVMKVLSEARDLLHRKMHQHGVGHGHHHHP